MIRAQDLRIGNWVRYSGNWCYRKCPTGTMFQWDTSDWYALGECTLSLDEIEPIPITEDILLKAGFVLQNPNARTYAHKGMGRYGYLENDGFRLAPLRTPMRSLHELQNVFFAIYKEELTIDL